MTDDWNAGVRAAAKVAGGYTSPAAYHIQQDILALLRPATGSAPGLEALQNAAQERLPLLLVNTLRTGAQQLETMRKDDRLTIKAAANAMRLAAKHIEQGSAPDAEAMRRVLEECAEHYFDEEVNPEMLAAEFRRRRLLAGAALHALALPREDGETRECPVCGVDATERFEAHDVFWHCDSKGVYPCPPKVASTPLPTDHSELAKRLRDDAVFIANVWSHNEASPIAKRMYAAASALDAALAGEEGVPRRCPDCKGTTFAEVYNSTKLRCVHCKRVLPAEPPP